MLFARREMNVDELARSIEQMAHDSLPPRLRAALNYCCAEHDAREVRSYIDRGYSEDEVFQLIMRTDAILTAGSA